MQSIYDAFSLLIGLIQKAEMEIVLVDGYVDVGTLNMLSKKKENVAVTVYTQQRTRLSQTDVDNFNAQYLILAGVDNVYHIFRKNESILRSTAVDIYGRSSCMQVIETCEKHIVYELCEIFGITIKFNTFGASYIKLTLIISEI